MVATGETPAVENCDETDLVGGILAGNVVLVVGILGLALLVSPGFEIGPFVRGAETECVVGVNSVCGKRTINNTHTSFIKNSESSIIHKRSRGYSYFVLSNRKETLPPKGAS